MKNLKKIAFLILVSTILMSCQKSDVSELNLQKSSFQNTVWTGEYTHLTKNDLAQIIEPVSLIFNENGTLVWHELVGEFQGSWNLEANKLKVTLLSNTDRSFEATVTSDNKLTNINSANKLLRINNMQLNIIDESSLANTVWESPELVKLPLTLKFMKNDKIDIEIMGQLVEVTTDVPHVMKAKSLRLFTSDLELFFVRSNNSSYKGAFKSKNGRDINSLLLVKQ